MTKSATIRGSTDPSNTAATIWMDPPTDERALIEVAVQFIDPNRSAPPEASRDRAAAFRLSRETEEPSASGWLWVSACLGYQEAREEISRRLSVAAWSPSPPRDPAYLSHLASCWLAASQGVAVSDRSAASPPQAFGPGAAKPRPPSVSDLRQRSVRQEISSVPEDLAYDFSFDDFRTQEDESDEAGLVAIPYVGDAGSRDGRAVMSSLADVVGRPLPAAGRRPPPGSVIVMVAELWPWALGFAHHVERMLALSAQDGAGGVSFPPFLLLGEPGAGKTTILERVLRHVSVPYQILACAGTSDAAGLSAVTRGWNGTRPSAPVQMIAQTGACNPVLVLDDLDSAPPPGGQNGSVLGALLPMVSGGSRYFDPCVMAPVDLTRVGFLGTVNSVQGLPRAVLDRFEVVEIPRPGPEHFVYLLAGARQMEAERRGLAVHAVPELDPIRSRRLKETYQASGRSLRAFGRAYRLLLGDLLLEREAAGRRKRSAVLH